MRGNRLALPAALILVGLALTSYGQTRPEPAALIIAQRDAMKPLAIMDGVWRGTAWTILPSGQKHTITQTERIEPFLDGSVKVIEGRGYDDDGSVSFNALGVISYNVTTRAYSLHSYAQGNAGDFVLRPTPDGYVWDTRPGRRLSVTRPLSRTASGVRSVTASCPAKNLFGSSR
jgi:hypothetical protein